MDLKGAYLKILTSDASNLIYTADTREKVKQAAADLEAGTLSPENASKIALGVSMVLMREFQTGEAFASSVAPEVVKARQSYLAAKVDELLPKLRQNGLAAVCASLEGVRASGDWTKIGAALIQANGDNQKAELHASIKADLKAKGLI